MHSKRNQKRHKMLILVLVVLALTSLYFFLKSYYEYWNKRGVPGPKPKFLLGNLGQSVIMKKSPMQIYTDIYNEFHNVPMVGVYRAFSPALLIRDPELIKDITIKSFSHFHDNDFDVDKDVDPIFGRNPFALKGEEWKMVRAQLTPGFTSGKMKWLYPHLEEISKQMVQFIEKQPETFNGKGYSAKELCTRFTLNNVATCAFGLEGKCFEEENSEFREIARKFLTPGSWTIVKALLVNIFPTVQKFVSIRFTPKEVEDKLVEIVTETLKYREKNNIVRNDFLHILSQLKKTCKDFEFTDIDVTSHAAGFFGDGYETSSVIMSFLLFQLAQNPEVQSKLREEINRNFTDNNQLPYEALQEMPYFDGVVNETLRLHPIVFTLNKKCTSPYNYTPEKNSPMRKSVLIEKGASIIIPIYGLHTDPRYFEDPESFKPERFIGENKEKIKKCTYMPFGEGPRACLGQRFGLLQIKVGVAYIIKHYSLSVNKKTKLPIQYDPTHPMITPIGGLWLDFKKIV